MHTHQVAALGNPTETPFICGICGAPHENHMCSLIRDDQPVEQANYMGNQQRQPFHDPNANTYNPRWRNHPNFCWGGNQNQRTSNFQNCPPHPPSQRPLFQQSPIPLHSPLTQQITSIESAIEKLTLSTTSFVQSTNAFIEETRANFKNQGAAIKNLKVQVGQLTKQLSEISSNPITNIREECNAISVRMAEEAPQEEEGALQEEQESVVEEVPQKINPSSSQLPKQQTRPFSRLLEVFACLDVNFSLLHNLKEKPTHVRYMKELMLKRKP
ncbi:hypothetical protein PIB30_000488 [Stylosanthes scabra]|uniref:Uncharacterized protein n=1 Tax=Stylosanthes scabra TaxID=79078 RepID=A0ABU6W0D9_9FABA|nr:hypothetical protein [Stylosanthes scabra]